jgi:hypothetical protein
MCVISRDHGKSFRMLWRLRGAGDLADRGGLASGKWKFSTDRVSFIVRRDDGSGKTWGSRGNLLPFPAHALKSTLAIPNAGA